MKFFNKVCLFSCILIFTCFLLTIGTSCNKNSSANNVIIDSVTLFGVGKPTTAVKSVSLNTLVRVAGSGFSAAKAIYCNGTSISINPVYVSNNNIILQIPSSLPFGTAVDSADRNTIRIVTSSGSYVYHFPILGPAPVITGVSHTLPKVGEPITIYGTNLRDIDTLTLPGNISVSISQLQISSDYKSVKLTVPQGGTKYPGTIYIHSANGKAYSPNYMNRYNCVFIQSFVSDTAVTGGTGDCFQRVYNYGSNITQNLTSLLPASGGGNTNPATYRQVPSTSNLGNVGVDSTVGGFYFRTCSMVNSLLNSSNGLVSATTSCDNLALQFDYFVPFTWQSGYMKFEFIGYNSSLRVNFAPWASTGSSVPLSMTGWQTANIPLSSFSALKGKTFQSLIDMAPTQGGDFLFVNSAYTYTSSGTVFPASTIQNFQMSFGNFRIVPLK